MADKPSRQILDGIPSRVLTFLIGVGKYIPVRAALGARGYTEEVHAHAWDLLRKLAIFPEGGVVNVDEAVRDAVVELDAWDEPNFAVIRAVLEGHYPEGVDFVFANLDPKQGSEAVLSVSTMLDRLDALEGAPERKATRKADHAALATLAARGYSKEERTRLRGLVTTAKTLEVAAPISNTEREATLLELYAWNNEWSTIARMVLTRRDHQIAVGIAKRRKSKKADAPPPGTPPAPGGTPEGTPGKPTGA